MHHWTHFIELIKKQFLNIHLQLNNLWSEPNSRWLSQLNDLQRHENHYNSVNFTNVLNFDVVQQQSSSINAQQIHLVLTYLTKSHNTEIVHSQLEGLIKTATTSSMMLVFGSYQKKMRFVVLKDFILFLLQCLNKRGLSTSNVYTCIHVKTHMTFLQEKTLALPALPIIEIQMSHNFVILQKYHLTCLVCFLSFYL